MNHSTHWNLALPSIADLHEPVLPVVVNNMTFGIPIHQVQYVDHAGPLTGLPLTTPPIEGLIQFNGLPLIQLNVAQALGFEGRVEGKIVIVTLPQGYLALKVDEVLSFISATAEEKSQSGESQQDLPLLKINEVFPWLNHIQVKNPVATDETDPFDEDERDSAVDNTPIQVNLNSYILLVSSAEHTIGLLAESVDRIEGIDDLLPLRKEDTEADLLVRIEDVLLPARSLATLLKAEGKPERQAILIRGLEKPSVLAVEHVSCLEKINHFHLTTSPGGNKSLWHLTEEGKSIEVINAREFFNKTEEYTTLPIVYPQASWDNLPQLATKLSTEGVRVECGEVICVLPLAIVERILGDLEEEGLKPIDSTKSSFNQLRSEQGKIPVINCVTLFRQIHHDQPVESHILLSLKCGYTVIAVHRAELQPTLPEDHWLPLTCAPPLATLLFDAAAFSESDQKWILRVKTDVDLMTAPWEVKRQLVASLLAWVYIPNLEETTEESIKEPASKRNFLSIYEHSMAYPSKKKGSFVKTNTPQL